MESVLAVDGIPWRPDALQPRCARRDRHRFLCDLVSAAQMFGILQHLDSRMNF